MIVVSLIGEQWSPQTAPAIHALIETVRIGSLASGKAAIQIGIRIPNVPHEVPVANARKQAIFLITLLLIHGGLILYSLIKRENFWEIL